MWLGTLICFGAIISIVTASSQYLMFCDLNRRRNRSFKAFSTSLEKALLSLSMGRNLMLGIEDLDFVIC